MQPSPQASFPELYEQCLVEPLFMPWVDPLLDDAELEPGNRILDLACGTGIVARRAQSRLGAIGKIVGVDSNPQMLAVARRVAPVIDWRQGDAGSLPLRDGEVFDAVLCQQGFQFFPDQAAAARQIRRALARSGRLSLSTWRPDEESPVLHELRAIAERHIGPIVDRRHGLGDPGPLEAVLLDAGFQDVRSKCLSKTIRFRDGTVFVRLNAMALVGMSAQATRLDDQGRQRIVQAITSDSADVVRAHNDDAGFAFAIGANFVSARA